MTKFTLEELNLIVAIIDVATKASGYDLAEKAFPIVQKMRLMVQELNAPPVAQTEEILPPMAEAAE